MTKYIAGIGALPGHPDAPRRNSGAKGSRERASTPISTATTTANARTTATTKSLVRTNRALIVEEPIHTSTFVR